MKPWFKICLQTQTETSAPQPNAYMDFLSASLHPMDKCCSLSTPDKNFVKICSSEQKLLHFIAGAKALLLHHVITENHLRRTNEPVAYQQKKKHWIWNLAVKIREEDQ